MIKGFGHQPAGFYLELLPLLGFVSVSNSVCLHNTYSHTYIHIYIYKYLFVYWDKTEKIENSNIFRFAALLAPVFHNSVLVQIKTSMVVLLHRSATTLKPPLGSSRAARTSMIHHGMDTRPMGLSCKMYVFILFVLFVCIPVRGLGTLIYMCSPCAGDRIIISSTFPWPIYNYVYFLCLSISNPQTFKDYKAMWDCRGK